MPRQKLLDYTNLPAVLRVFLMVYFPMEGLAYTFFSVSASMFTENFPAAWAKLEPFRIKKAIK